MQVVVHAEEGAVPSPTPERTRLKKIQVTFRRPACNHSSNVTDELLMAKVRDGDLAPLGVLFERYHLRLFDFLSRVTGDRVEAQDLVQDVFVRVLKYRSTYRNGASVQTWLFRIARNSTADYFRRRPRREWPTEALRDSPDVGPDPEQIFESSRNQLRLHRALMALRDDQRELIVLARYQGLSSEQLAEIYGLEVGTVRVRIHRAVGELRDIFEHVSDGCLSWNANRFRQNSRNT
jgi:RNA polymerase sigma-70 factor, ECF subfamily